MTVLLWAMFVGRAPLETINQGFGIEQLSEKAFGADRHGFIVQSHVKQRCDRDYGAIAPAPGGLVQGEVHSFRGDTVEEGQVRRAQEHLGTDQIHQGRAEHFVLVDDRDESGTHEM